MVISLGSLPFFEERGGRGEMLGDKEKIIDAVEETKHKLQTEASHIFHVCRREKIEL